MSQTRKQWISMGVLVTIVSLLSSAMTVGITWGSNQLRVSTLEKQTEINRLEIVRMQDRIEEQYRLIVSQNAEILQKLNTFMIEQASLHGRR